MAFNFNGNTSKNIIYNNQEVARLIYNNVLVWQKQRLPQGYQEVEYIETTGTQYIDTGFIANQDTRFVLKIKYIAGNFIFGSDGDSTGRLNAVGLNKSTSRDTFRWHYDSQKLKDNGDFVYGTIYDIDINKNIMYLDGELIATFNYVNFSTPSSVVISGINRDNTVNMASYGSSIAIYKFQIYDNGTLIRDFIPCYRYSDGEIGLYDVINDVFYTNQGEGTFVKGKDVYTLPGEYQEVEYIESTGTQYIDTGIASTRYITATLDMQFTKQSSSTMIIIAWSTGAGRWFGKGSSNTYSAGNNAVSDIDCLTRKEIEVTFTNSNITYVIDGTTYSKSAAASSQSITYTMFAGRNVNTGISYYSRAKLYKAVIQENGNTIMDFVPCYRKADGEIGLYDVVNDDFYTNAGSGEFTVGPDVN